MSKRFIKFFLVFTQIAVLVPYLCSAALINDTTGGKMGSQTEALREKAGFEEVTEDGMGIADVVAVVLNAFFGLLGLLFVSYIILAGYQWMTAQGEEQKVKDGKDTIRNAVIGLIIIMAAYSITYFVFESLDDVGGT